MRAEPVGAPCAVHGEGPFWDEPSASLLLVDLLAGDVVRLDDAGTPARSHVGTVAAALRRRASGGYVLALERGFAFADEQLRVTGEVAVFDDPAVRMNDGGCDPQGRFYCGTMAHDATPGAGSLFRLDTDGSVATVLKGVTISNGLQWSADGTLVYYIDTPTGRVDVFDVDPATGAFHERRPFAVVPEGKGLPDGMAIDTEGGIWVALWEGGAVHRYDADGVLTAVVEVPASRTTACAFGGPDLRTLYVTTSQLGVPDGAEPLAGAVFAVDTGVVGAVQHAYAG
ncbi:SMP-30/gluconolactonase/LRE family protein [Antribacter gilvus]|uniref:SMP-30/gluconolactonase/LRE family protein n=1 Tax=Antribacter gilvus TaxID=2304675 RepID=UPI000F78D44C|nr:SMP-30/gluconolactonase/LRE family protein [Antribacter gilvus]